MSAAAQCGLCVVCPVQRRHNECKPKCLHNGNREEGRTTAWADAIITMHATSFSSDPSCPFDSQYAFVRLSGVDLSHNSPWDRVQEPWQALSVLLWSRYETILM